LVRYNPAEGVTNYSQALTDAWDQRAASPRLSLYQELPSLSPNPGGGSWLKVPLHRAAGGPEMPF